MSHEAGSMIALSLLAALAAAGFFGPRSIQYVAAIAGVAGAAMLASKIDPAWGFAAFLLSNVGWLIFSASERHWGLFAQQVAFFVTSLVGLWNWWLGPLVLG